MSPSIWTQCGGKKRFKKLSLQVFRVVQPQTQKALYKLVDNLEESDILEELLESSKPPKPSDDLTDEKLIFTPFRYPPLKHGSRFGSGHERGIWYGAPEVMTDFYEVIYYRYLFREHSPGLKSRVQILSMTSFEVKI